MKKILIPVLGAVVAVSLFAGGAQAGRQITSHDIRNNTVKSVDIKDGSVRMRDLTEAVIARIDARHAGTGAQGPAGPVGPRGAKGEQGEKGDPASDTWGSGRTVFDSAGVIANIGGRFSERATEMGTVTLEPGTYLINTSGYFDRIDNSQSSSPQMQVAVRGDEGEQMGTILTGNFPATGDREITGSAAQIVTLLTQTDVTVYAFGYNNDGSSAGSGNYVANVQVFATRVG